MLDFIQDKLEEYVEDNNIAGGDVEQGVRLCLATHSVSNAHDCACSCFFLTDPLLGAMHLVATLRTHAHTAAARGCDSKAGAVWNICVQQADAKPPDMAVIPNQVSLSSSAPHTQSSVRSIGSGSWHVGCTLPS